MTYRFAPRFSKTCLVLGIALSLAAQIASTQSAAAASLKVDVQNIAQPKGTLMVAIFNSQDGFSKNEAVQGQRIAVKGNKMAIRFEDLPSGIYAIKMFQDVNDNGQLDMQDGAVPTEPFGFSNDAPAIHGPASWSDARFAVHDGQNRQTVHLKTLSF
ncbi:MAG: DUF2141 domain-containing protein [Robiginitomaculum sp.]|nr:DUF2141 domain-containing protein [Robiginitomaculum sp.]MDQ7076281.1 DUF2141 domain-containing protein [Robiginitomaculum sp.]